MRRRRPAGRRRGPRSPPRLAGRLRRRSAAGRRRRPGRRGRARSTCWPTPPGGSAGSTTASRPASRPTAPTRSSATTAGPGSARCGSTSTTAFRARPAIAGGWLRRARRALDDDPECVEHGALLLREAERPTAAASSTRPPALAARCVDLGRRLRSADLEAEALQTIGRVLIDHGRVDRGPGPPRRGDALRRRGPARPVLDRQGVLQPDQRLRGARRPAPGRGVDRGHRRGGRSEHPFAIFPGHLPRPPGRRARPAGRAGRRRAGGEPRRATSCSAATSPTPPPPSPRSATSAAASATSTGPRRRSPGPRSCAGGACAGARAAAPGPGPGRRRGRRSSPAAWPASRRTGSPGPALLPAVVQIAVAAGDLDAAEASVDGARGDRRRLRHARPRTPSAALARGRLAARRRATPTAAATLREAAAALAGARGALRGGHHAHPARPGAARGRATRTAAAQSFAAARALFDQIGARLDARRVGRRPVPPVAAPGRPHRPRGRGAAAHRRRPVQQGDRRRAPPQREDRRPGTSRTSSPRSACPPGRPPPPSPSSTTSSAARRSTHGVSTPAARQPEWGCRRCRLPPASPRPWPGAPRTGSGSCSPAPTWRSPAGSSSSATGRRSTSSTRSAPATARSFRAWEALDEPGRASLEQQLVGLATDTNTATGALAVPSDYVEVVVTRPPLRGAGKKSSGPTGAPSRSCGKVFFVARRNQRRKAKVTAGDISRSGPSISAGQSLFRSLPGSVAQRPAERLGRPSPS